VDSPETSQIQHIDFDLLEAIAPIRLQTEHMSIDYGAVEFPKRKLQLWLPETVSFYIDVEATDFLTATNSRIISSSRWIRTSR